MDFYRRRFLNMNVMMEWERFEGSLGCIGSQLSASKKAICDSLECHDKLEVCLVFLFSVYVVLIL